MPPVTIPFDQGWVTRRDRARLTLGEMQAVTGGWYPPGDDRLWKIGGRSSFADTGAAAIVRGLYLAQFDSGGTDLLLALRGTTLRKATPGASGSFSDFSPAPTMDAADTLSGAHWNNRHYLCFGTTLNKVLESDGSLRGMGMNPPLEAPTAAASTVAQAFQRPATADSAINYGAGIEGWLKTSTVLEGTKVAGSPTFAYVTIGKADQYTSAKEQTWNFGSYTAATSRLEVTYRLTTGNINTNPGDKVGAGGSAAGRFKVRIIIKYSLNNGSSYTEIVNTVLETSMPDVITVQVPVADATYNGATAIKVIASAQLVNKGDGVSFRIADIRMAKGGAASNITTTTGFYYAVTEYDSTRDQESGHSPVSSIVTMTANNLVTLTLPTAVQNSRATHWRIYRTPDGGVAPSQLGRVEEVPISQTTWLDSFIRPYDEQASFIVPLVTTSAASGTLYYTLNHMPPSCKQFFVHRGRMIGIPASSDRTLAYSEPGLPESWPEINSDNDFPLREGDRLIAGCSLGDMIVAFCSQTVLTQQDVPSWTDGTFRATQKSVLSGAPGIVGQDAFCLLDAGGETLVAWVTRYGIYVTDGHSCRRVSDDRAWDTDVTVANLGTAKLHWDRNRQAIIFAWDSSAGGVNDRWALIHMAPEHRKESGQPKWTGPHYGKLNCMASGIVSGVHRLWSGHTSDGFVYLEDNGTTDASQAYSSTQVPAIWQTGRIYGDVIAAGLNWRRFGIYKGNLRHTALSGQTVSVLVNTYDDPAGTSAAQTVTKTPSLTGQVGTEFYAGIGNEAAEFTLTHTGSGTWGLLDMRLDVQPLGRVGRVA